MIYDITLIQSYVLMGANVCIYKKIKQNFKTNEKIKTSLKCFKNDFSFLLKSESSNIMTLCS